MSRSSTRENDGKAFHGTVVHSMGIESPMEILPSTLLVVDGKKVVFIEPNMSVVKARQIASDYGVSDNRFTELKDGDFLIPGFVDTHIHAPQYVNVGLGLSYALLEWLEAYTFPAEKRFSDMEFARDVYTKVVKRTLSHGTTSASYFATIHLEPSLLLAEIMAKYGQRGFVGKVNMDQNSPDDYCETTQQSLADTITFIERMQEQYSNDGLITPCITPRFCMSCTEGLMADLAKLSDKYGVPIQTHMSENRKEVACVKEMFHLKEYVEVYEKAGLLKDCTILAHCVYSGPEELDIVKRYNCGIAHCPNSNLSLISGGMDAQQVIGTGIKLGLGTDVAGGYSPSLLDNLRKAVEVSKLLTAQRGDDSKNINYSHAFHLATLGGAQVMNLDNKIGNFLVGKEFDALVISPRAKSSSFDAFDFHNQEELIQKFLFCGDDRNISKIYVAGRRVNLDL